jgi:hypothetical protein
MAFTVGRSKAQLRTFSCRGRILALMCWRDDHCLVTHLLQLPMQYSQVMQRDRWNA